MATVKCTTCGDVMESREMHSCAACGAMACPACGASNHGLCSFCYSELNYLN